MLRLSVPTRLTQVTALGVRHSVAERHASPPKLPTVRELLRRSMHSEAALRDNGGSSGAVSAPGSEEASGKSEPAGVGKEWEKPPGAEAKRGGMVWDIAWSPPPG